MWSLSTLISESVVHAVSHIAILLLHGAGQLLRPVRSDGLLLAVQSCDGNAGALGGYMWRNREVNQSTDKLLSIAGIAAISLAMGWSNETKVDNLGQYRILLFFGCRGDTGGERGGGGGGWAIHLLTA